nr:hypothetical protein [Stutzerimonas kirkiae]
MGMKAVGLGQFEQVELQAAVEDDRALAAVAQFELPEGLLVVEQVEVHQVNADHRLQLVVVIPRL